MIIQGIFFIIDLNRREDGSSIGNVSKHKVDNGPLSEMVHTKICIS
jgi:hypothetical protein